MAWTRKKKTPQRPKSPSGPPPKCNCKPIYGIHSDSCPTTWTR